MRRISSVLSAAAVLASTWLLVGPSVASQATASGHNGLIAFVRQGQIFTVDSSGDHLTQLTHYKAPLASQPKWSPDGTHIAYVAGYDDYRDKYIWVMKADGSHKHRLWKGIDPTWSPNGKVLAYVATLLLPPTDPNAGCQYTEVFTRPVDKSEPAQLINREGLGGCEPMTLRTQYGSEMSWSSQDHLIYVGILTGDFAGAGQDDYVVSMTVTGMHPGGTDLGPNNTTNPIVLKRSQGVGDHQPTNLAPPTVDVDPDHDRIVYSEALPTKDAKAGRIRLQATDDSDVELISDDPFASLPVFSPNGKSVLYVKHKPGTHSSLIKQIKLSTLDTKTLLHGSQPDWQPT